MRVKAIEHEYLPPVLDSSPPTKRKGNFVIYANSRN